MTYPPPPQNPDPSGYGQVPPGQQPPMPQQPGYGPQDPNAAQPGYGPPPQGGYPQQNVQYPQPGMAQPGAGASKQQMKLFAGIGGGFVLLIIIIVIAVSSGGGPGSVVDDYFGAVKDLDAEESASYLCDMDDQEMFSEEDLDDPSARAEAEEFVKDMEWEILDEEESGNTATVTVKVTGTDWMDGNTEIELEQRGGDWCISEG